MNNELKLAGQGSRIVNVIIDMICIFILWIIISILGLLIGLDSMNTNDSGETIPIFPLILLVPIFWAYYAIMEITFQRTVGKFLTKTIVVNNSGEQPTSKQIIFRTLSRSIPFEYFSYLGTTNGIHDRISGTNVVKIK